MQIESITARNFRCLRDITLDNLTRMTIVVGPNGSGTITVKAYAIGTAIRAN